MLKCETCRFWRYLRETEPHVGIGECRRYAPRPIVVEPRNKGAYPLWPLTMFDDACGEHQPKDTTP